MLQPGSPLVMPPRVPSFDTTRGRRGCRIMAASCSPLLLIFCAIPPCLFLCAGSPRGWQDVKRKKGVHGKKHCHACTESLCFLGTAVWFGSLSSIAAAAVLACFYSESFVLHFHRVSISAYGQREVGLHSVASPGRHELWTFSNLRIWWCWPILSSSKLLLSHVLVRVIMSLVHIVLSTAVNPPGARLLFTLLLY